MSHDVVIFPSLFLNGRMYNRKRVWKTVALLVTRVILSISPPERHRFKPATVLIPSSERLEHSHLGSKMTVGLPESKGRLGREVCSGKGSIIGAKGFPSERSERVFASELGSVQLACAVGINTYTKTSQNGIH